MKKIIAIAVLLSVTPALAGENYYPTPTRDGRERLQRTGTCPTGYVGKGKFCEAMHNDTPRSYQLVPGRSCPRGTFRSGNFCKAFR